MGAGGLGRRRRWPVAAGAVVVLAVTAVVVAVVTSGSGAASPVPTARGFTLPPVIAGQPPVVLPSAPGRPVVLNFFASWCVPCTEELPMLERLSRTWQAEDAGAGSATVPMVVGIDELDQRPDGPAMVRQAGVTFPSGYDHDGSVGRRWLVNGLPITVFVAPDGRVIDYHRGQLRQTQLDSLVRRLQAASG
jgi:cytochrome c biogenesis protein CcmG, thiol:disulfide interchange protein DsbE